MGFVATTTSGVKRGKEACQTITAPTKRKCPAERGEIEADEIIKLRELRDDVAALTAQRLHDASKQINGFKSEKTRWTTQHGAEELKQLADDFAREKIAIQLCNHKVMKETLETIEKERLKERLGFEMQCKLNSPWNFENCTHFNSKLQRTLFGLPLEAFTAFVEFVGLMGLQRTWVHQYKLDRLRLGGVTA